MAPRREKEGWFKRNILWMAPVGCLGFLAILAIVGFGLFTGIKQSFIFSEGVALAAGNAEVVAALGEPIEAGFGFSGQIDLENQSGSANGSIPIKGPNGTAKLYVIATKRDGEWTFEEAEVELDGRDQRIDLLSEE